jgi:hypothetical protein
MSSSARGSALPLPATAAEIAGGRERKAGNKHAGRCVHRRGELEKL